MTDNRKNIMSVNVVSSYQRVITSLQARLSSLDRTNSTLTTRLAQLQISKVHWQKAADSSLKELKLRQKKSKASEKNENAQLEKQRAGAKRWLKEQVERIEADHNKRIGDLRRQRDDLASRVKKCHSRN